MSSYQLPGGRMDSDAGMGNVERIYSSGTVREHWPVILLNNISYIESTHSWHCKFKYMKSIFPWILEHPTRLQTCVRNVSTSHLGLDTHNHNIFSGFPQFILVNVWTVPYNYATTRLLKFLQKIYLYISKYSTLYSFWLTGKKVNRYWPNADLNSRGISVVRGPMSSSVSCWFFLILCHILATSEIRNLRDFLGK